MTQNVAPTAPLNLLENTSEVLGHLQKVEDWIAASPLDPKLVHMLKLRASQLNGCAHCVKMHANDLRAAGESDARLDHLIVWRHAKGFSEAERAALDWIETLTELSPGASHGAGRAKLRAHFSEQGIATLTVVASMINLWNRVQVSNH